MALPRPDKEAKKRIEVHRVELIAALAVAAILVMIVIFMNRGSQTAVPCESVSDCTGLQHPECDGEWRCKGTCEWYCPVPDKPCSTAADCGDRPHTHCDGAWTCEDDECVWWCAAREGSPEYEYVVGECDESAKRGGSTSFSATVDGIAMTQVLDYVCCAEIELAVMQVGNLINITEKNSGEICKCMCSYDVSAEVKVLPGTYKIEVWGVEYPGYELEKLGESTISVEKTEGSVLFIDQHEIRTGRIIAGDWTQMLLGSPTYSFDDDTRVLSGTMDFELDGILAIFGNGVTYGGNLGNRVATELAAVTSVPFTSDGYSITRILEDGTITMSYNNETIKLKPGETWNKVVTTDEAKQNIGLIRITSNNTITNYGFLESGNVIKQ